MDKQFKITYSTTKRLLENDVLVLVTAAGLCGTDEYFKFHDMVLRHEGISIVKQVSPEVQTLQKGDRKESFLLRLLNSLTDVKAAPLMCARSSVFSALKNASLLLGDKVRIIGVGSLSYLAIQFAAKQGYRVTAFSRTSTKRDNAIGLGAVKFHELSEFSDDSITPLDVLLIATSCLVNLMALRGRVVILSTLDREINIPAILLVIRALSIQGLAIALRCCSTEMLQFASRNMIRPIVETFLLTVEGITKAM
ncbi:NAD(P)-binding protein [Massarina eburnea CBS 473.64]|uniref:NAD(P)-binding protein n=1 Tax=Massarina eburnea CBS 473.64 TaxID=1395130 RepID=A0A6A6RXT4_9PLEO|nr:NAD(P)-binding protein [Massarina eburnea CBS 473.64]